MKTNLIKLLKDWLPPILTRSISKIKNRGKVVEFDGPYISWSEASNQSTGYGVDIILQKVLSATLKVKCGEAAFERDSVVFDKIQYSCPVTAGLMAAAAKDGGALCVLDYGGALGSTYFQYKNFIEGLKSVRWKVVEQLHFVKMGRQGFQDDQLSFHSSISECLLAEKPNVILLSSVLQYIETHYEVLHELMLSGADFIIFDRTPFHSGNADLVVKQIVPKAIYSASYPMWILSKQKLIDSLSGHYKPIVEQLSPEGNMSIASCDFSFASIIFKKKNLYEK